MEVIEILSFCSAALACFVALPLLLLRAQGGMPQRWLGAFMLSVAMLSVSSTVWYYLRPGLFGLLDWPVAVLGPCFYFYVRRMVGLGLGRRPGLHFVPLAVLVGLLLWAQGGLAERKPYFEDILVAFELQATVYVLIAAVQLHRYRRRLAQSFSSLKGRDLLWLSWLSLVVAVLLANCVLASLVGGVWIWLLMVLRLAVVYVVGWWGLRQGTISLPEELPDGLPLERAPEPSPVLASPTDAQKYARSGLTDGARELIEARLGSRMAQTRDYLENDLTLAQLAERIGASPQWLSQVLNDGLELSFFDYVNGLRVAEVQRLLADPARAKTPVLDLAFEAGFNSKSTFNAAFRRVSGMTPSEWRRSGVQAPGQP